MVIANGNNKNPIKKIIRNKKCTWFYQEFLNLMQENNGSLDQ